MRNERVSPARVKPSPARWVALTGLLGLLASPAFATPPPPDAEVEALLASLRRDQAAARDGLAALRAEPLAATGADAVLTDLDAFFEGEGKRQLGLAAREAGLELARVPIPEGALELLLAELHTVVGGQGVEGVAHRFTERAEGPIAAVLDARMATLRSALDTRIGEALGSQMLEIQGKFDAVVAARFPAWEAAVVVPILPAPGLEVPADAQGQLVDADRRLRWGARAGLMAAPFAARIGARLGADLGRQATERAVQSVSRKVAGRLAGALTGIGAVLAAADTLIDLATIRERYRDELVRVMAAALRESLTPALVWRGTGDATPRTEVHQRVETKLAAWIEEAARRSEAVVEAGPALSSPQAREFIVKVMADGGDRDALLARLTTLQRTFGPALAGRHPLGVLDAMLQHGEPATVGTLAARLGDQLVVLYQQHGPELLRAADRLGPAILLESLGDPSIDWRALATSLPPGASPEAARGALLSLRLGLDPLALGLSAADLATFATHEGPARALLATGLAPREAAAVLLDGHARAGIEALDDEGLLGALAPTLGVERMRRLGREPALATALARVYRHGEATGRFTPTTRGQHLEAAWRLAPITRQHGEAGLRIYLAEADAGGERAEADAARAVALLERLNPEILLDDRARRMLLNHSDTFYGDLLVGLFRFTGPGGATAVQALVVMLLLIPLAIAWRMLRLFRQPRPDAAARKPAG